MSEEKAIRLRLLDTAKTVGLLAALAGVAALVGFLALGVQGLLVAFIAVVFLSVAGLRVPPEWVIRMQGGHAVDRRAAPELARLVDSLSARAGIARPRLFLIPSDTPNALAVGSRQRGALAVTTGALAVLRVEEVEGVLAHEVAHLKNNDTEVLRLAVLVSQAVTTLVRVSAWMALLLSLFFGFDPGRLLLLAAVALFSPVVLGLLQAAISRTRELAADSTAATLTGKPRALASALATIARFESHWIRRMLAGRPQAQFLRSHPATRERVERLLAMSEPEDEAPRRLRDPQILRRPVSRPRRIYRIVV